MKKYGNLFKLLGVVLWLVIILQLDLGRVLSVAEKADPAWIIPAVFFLFTTFLFKGMRWRVPLQAQHITLSIPKVVGIVLVSSFVGFLTPGRIGDFVRVGYLKQENLTLASGFANTLLDRSYDLVILILIGLAGMFYFGSLLSAPLALVVLGLCIVSVSVTVAFALRYRVAVNLKRAMKYALPQAQYDLLSEGWSEFSTEFRRLAVYTYPMMFLFSFFLYASYFLQIYALARSLGISISFWYLTMSFSVAALISLLPISVGGLGTREGVLILLLGRISLPPETVVILSFLDNVVFGMLLGGITALVFWLLSGRNRYAAA